MYNGRGKLFPVNRYYLNLYSLSVDDLTLIAAVFLKLSTHSYLFHIFICYLFK